MRSQSKASLSADQMNFDRGAKENWQVPIGGLAPSSSCRTVVGVSLRNHKDATEGWYRQLCRCRLREDALSRNRDLDRFLGAMVVSTTTPRVSNVDMAAVAKGQKQADKTTNNRSWHMCHVSLARAMLFDVARVSVLV